MGVISTSPGGTVLQVSTSLTSAQILAIFTTPVTVVQAAGAGVVILPVAWAAAYTFVSTAYTDGGGNLQLKVGGGCRVWSSFATTGWWTSGASSVEYATFTSNNAGTASLTNQPLQVQQSAANPTLGNGTVIITVWYVEVAAS